MRFRPGGSGDEQPLVEAIGQCPRRCHHSMCLAVLRSTSSMTSGERSHEPRAASRWKYGAVPVIGLTGGLASGKSSVARLLLERGFALIDADAVGHEVLDLPEVQRKLLDRFGPDVVPGRGVSSSSKPRVDRKALGAIVFADPNARHFLESIVHQLMRARFLEKIEKEERSAQPPCTGLCSMPRSCLKRGGSCYATQSRSSILRGPSGWSVRPSIAAGRTRISQRGSGLNGRPS